MTQYTPVRSPDLPAGKRSRIPGRYLHKTESEKLVDWLEDLGIDDGYVQELVPNDSWLPDFTLHNPFGTGLFKTVFPSLPT